MSAKKKSALRVAKPKKKLTAELLGQILYEEFERDNWGEIDPFYFDPSNCVDDQKEMHTMTVLARVAKEINKVFA